MAYTRGSRDDYDRWANITGDDGWTWDNLYPYMIKVSHSVRLVLCIHSEILALCVDLKLENLTEPSSGLDVSGEYDPSVHGYSGESGKYIHIKPSLSTNMSL